MDFGGELSGHVFFRDRWLGFDDGIYAGITMYKSLCDIRSEQEKNSWKNDKICWEKELEHIYNIASWVVLCHNIWFVQKNEKCNCELYEKFNLNSLVLEKDKHKIKRL